MQVSPALLGCIYRVRLGMCAGSLMLRTCRVLAFVLLSRVPSFCPLSRFVFGALALNMALFRVFRGFLARFMGFVWVCVACVLCVACGAFVRVNS